MAESLKKSTHLMRPGTRRDASSITIPHAPAFVVMETTETNLYQITDVNNGTRNKYLYKGIDYDATGICGVKTSAGATLATGLVYLIV